MLARHGVKFNPSPNAVNLGIFQVTLEARSDRTDIVLSSISRASLYRPNVRMAEQFRAGRVFLAGAPRACPSVCPRTGVHS